jgi:hypothetical protein
MPNANVKISNKALGIVASNAKKETVTEVVFWTTNIPNMINRIIIIT